MTSLPGMAGSGSIPGLAGVPEVLYGLKLTAAGTPYELRAIRASATVTPPAAPLFAVYRCVNLCAEIARIGGGIGTTGREVVISVPLSVLGIAGGAQLTDVRAFTAAVETGVGQLQQLDSVALGTLSIPAPTVSLGLAPAGTPGSEVAFEHASTQTGGAFTGTIPASTAPGSHDVWARACLGEVCGTSSARL